MQLCLFSCIINLVFYYRKGVIYVAYQKGLNKNRNHHDNLSFSGKGRAKKDDFYTQTFKAIEQSINAVTNPYGQGKHKKGGKPKQFHW